MRALFSISISLALSAVIAGCAGTYGAASNASEPPAIILFDGTDMGAFERLGNSNWRVEDGAVVADAAREPSYLISKARFGDFKLIVEFYASTDANSGVFIRCQDANRVTDRNCYEANIFDQRPDPSYGTGAIVLHTEVDSLSKAGGPKAGGPKAGGQWNTYEITAKGRDITLVLNGVKTAQLRSGLFAEGFVALQHAAGVMKFRKVVLEPLSP